MLLAPWCLLVILQVADGPVGVQISILGDPAKVEVVATLPPRLTDRMRDGSLGPGEAERLLRVGLVDEKSGQVGDPLFGVYRLDRQRVTFVPRHGLMAGNLYRAVLRLPTGQTFTANHRVTAGKPMPATEVESIYPSSDRLPANLLKFYLHFSAPMRESDEFFERIQLLDDQGRPIAAPRRRTELWSEDAKRLTLFIHPGRIKSGVNLREQEGPVLMPNRKYSLVVTSDVQDAEGRPLAKPFTKQFSTTAENRSRPLPESWQVVPPQAGTREAVVVRFPEPLDRHLLIRCLTVVDDAKHAIPGRVEIADQERTWRFAPDVPWRKSEYRLEVEAILEDLAGNTPARVFDTDLEAVTPAPPALSSPFQPR